MANIDTKWFILFTKPGCERKVVKMLSKKKIENYYPINRIVQKRGDKKKTTVEPLFPSFVFAKVKEPQHEEIKKAEGIINFLYWKDKPAEIGDIEIEMVRFFLTAHSNVKVEKSPVNAREVVRFISEPSIEREGNLMSIKINTEKVILPSLGYLLVAEVEKGTVHEFDESETFYHNDPAYKYAVKQ